MANLLKNSKLLAILNQTAVGTTAVNSSVVDTAGFDSALLVCKFGTITDGTTGVKAQQGAVSDGSDMADLAGTQVTVAVTDDNRMAAVEVVRPLERYLRLVVLRGGVTGAVIDGAVALLFNAHNLPVAQDATHLAASELHISPAEGTA